jgi:DNA-binding MarR family transcriptional regulator
VSRGIGKVQREALAALWDRAKSEGIAGGMPLAELKRCIGADRSNSRRAIRGLIERGLVVEVTAEEGERRVALTGGAHMALWLATEYKDEALTIERVPSRPLVLDLGDDLGLVEEDTLGLDNLMSLGIPHEPSPPPPDRPVSDNVPSNRGRGDAMQARVSHANAPLSPDQRVSGNEARAPGRGYPMQSRTPHASTPRTSDRGVTDNASYTRGLGLEIAARMAREWLERLDAEAAEEGEA